MLVENLWTEHGLVNGVLGVVYNIIWAVGVDQQRDPPLAVLVVYNKYKGPRLFKVNSKPVVPVFILTQEFFWGAISCQRTQFPITIAYAITIHKAQGLTVKRAVLDINQREFAVGLNYIAILRVKTLQGLLFKEAFNLTRFRRSGGDTVIIRTADAVQRHPQHIQHPTI